MPEIPIPENFISSPANALNTGHLLLAYMIHPSDASARDVFIKASNQQIVTHLKKVKKEIVAKYTAPAPGIKNKIENRYDRSMDEKVISNLILTKDSEDFLLSINAQTEIFKFREPDIQKDWKTVALIAYCLLNMSQYHVDLRGGISVKKACYFLEVCIKDKLLPGGEQIRSNNRDMKKAWRKYKSIVHLTVPYYQMLSQPNSDLNIYTQSGVQNFIAMAAGLQQALLSIKTKHGEKDKILERQELWRLPKRFDLQRTLIQVEEFNNNQKEILFNYQYGS